MKRTKFALICKLWKLSWRFLGLTKIFRAYKAISQILRLVSELDLSCRRTNFHEKRGWGYKDSKKNTHLKSDPFVFRFARAWSIQIAIDCIFDPPICQFKFFFLQIINGRLMRWLEKNWRRMPTVSNRWQWILQNTQKKVFSTLPTHPPGKKEKMENGMHPPEAEAWQLIRPNLAGQSFPFSPKIVPDCKSVPGWSFCWYCAHQQHHQDQDQHQDYHHRHHCKRTKHLRPKLVSSMLESCGVGSLQELTSSASLSGSFIHN